MGQKDEYGFDLDDSNIPFVENLGFGEEGIVITKDQLAIKELWNMYNLFMSELEEEVIKSKHVYTFEFGVTVITVNFFTLHIGEPRIQVDYDGGQRLWAGYVVIDNLFNELTELMEIIKKSDPVMESGWTEIYL